MDELQIGINSFMLGRTITKVRYLTKKEADKMGWFKRPVVIELDNGEWFIPASDDELNDGGAIYTSDQKFGVSTIPVG